MIMITLSAFLTFCPSIDVYINSGEKTLTAEHVKFIALSAARCGKVFKGEAPCLLEFIVQKDKHFNAVCGGKDEKVKG